MEKPASPGEKLTIEAISRFAAALGLHNEEII
jgi:hypothetical protein